MPVTITVNHLAVETRVSTDSAVSPPEPWATILGRLLEASKGIVEDYAPDAPEDAQNHAVVLMAGYGVEAPYYTRGAQNAFVNSGAKAMLARWHSIGSAKVDNAST